MQLSSRLRRQAETAATRERSGPPAVSRRHRGRWRLVEPRLQLPRATAREAHRAIPTILERRMGAQQAIALSA